MASQFAIFGAQDVEYTLARPFSINCTLFIKHTLLEHYVPHRNHVIDEETCSRVPKIYSSEMLWVYFIQ